MDFWLFVAGTIGIYAIAALSLNIVIGMAGIFSVAHGALMGVGAFTSALLVVEHGWSFLAATLAAMVVSLVVAGALALPTLRTHSGVYVVMSFAMQIVILTVMLNWNGLTRGASGIPNIPRPSIFGLDIEPGWSFTIFVWMFVAVTALLCWLLARAPVGILIKAVREDEVVVESFGKNPRLVKWTVFIGGAAGAGLAGSLFASYFQFVEPTVFNTQLSIMFISMVVLGGIGNPVAPVIGAILLMVLPEALERFDVISGDNAAEFQQMLFGIALAVIVAVRPRGLFPEGVRLKIRRANRGLDESAST